MPVEAKLEMITARGGGIATPIHFASGNRQLFGWLHRGTNFSVADVAMLICNPFGYEAMCAHRSVRALAEMATRNGVPALRFDYSGTGDSSDIDDSANQISLWEEDVIAAMDELKRRVGAKRVVIAGLRLGASVALLAAKDLPTASLVLIAPILDGKRLLRELRVTRLASNSSRQRLSPTDDHLALSEGIEASGYLLHAATVSALLDFDMTKSPMPMSQDILILDDPIIPRAKEWAASITAGPGHSCYMTVPSLMSMVITPPHFQNVPEAVLKVVDEWLRDLIARRPATKDLASTGEQIRDAFLTTSAISADGGVTIRPSNTTERPVVFGSRHALFGIVTEPPSIDRPVTAVILLNSGATHHVGGSRMHVTLARRWAGDGYLVLRFDLAGLGDSVTNSDQSNYDVFPEHALSDIKDAINFLSANYTIESIALGGICSGAYHAFRAVAESFPVSGVLLVNPSNYFPSENMSVRENPPAERGYSLDLPSDRIFVLRGLRKLLTGQVDRWEVMRTHFKSVVQLGTKMRDLARSLGIALRYDLGSELSRITSRGVQITLVFARGEPGLDLLRYRAGSCLNGLTGRCRLYVVDNGDHVFTHCNARAQVENILSHELAQISKGSFQTSRSMTPGVRLESTTAP